MVWLNNARLLFIVLVPFTTNLTTEYSEYLAGRLAMPVTLFLAIFFSWLQWRWAVAHRDVMLPDMSQEDAVAYGRSSLSALLISATVVVLAPWIGSLAFLLFFLDRSGAGSARMTAASLRRLADHWPGVQGIPWRLHAACVLTTLDLVNAQHRDVDQREVIIEYELRGGIASPLSPWVWPLVVGGLVAFAVVLWRWQAA